MKRLILLLLAIPVFTPVFSQHGWEIRLMPQAAFGTKNTLQRPGDQGTRFSLDKEFNRKNEGVFSPRLELEYTVKRHHLIATAAWLQNRFNGTSPQNIYYNEVLFGAGTEIDAHYRFDTYRLGYRYRIVDSPALAFELGATVLFRDAVISLRNPEHKSSYSNVGVAPLLSYLLEWQAAERFSLLTYGDAFAVKAGRAEDIFAGIKYSFSPILSGRAGYRFLEGGSDGDRIYTMAAFHYLSFGLGIRF